MFRVSGSYNWTDNQHTTLSVINPLTGVRTSSPANINGNWGANSYIFLTKAIGDVTVAALTNYASMSAMGWSETQQYGNTSMVVLRLAVKLNHFR